MTIRIYALKSIIIIYKSLIIYIYWNINWNYDIKKFKLWQKSHNVKIMTLSRNNDNLDTCIKKSIVINWNYDIKKFKMTTVLI